MTKTVNYRGKQYTVPDWVTFIATDLDGAIFGYQMKPTMDLVSEKYVATKGRVCRLRWPEWQDTLQEIDD